MLNINRTIYAHTSAMLALFIVTGCFQGESDTYVYNFKSSNPEKQDRLVEKLPSSGIEHRINKDGSVTFKKKDMARIYELMVKHNEPQFPIPDSAKSWKISYQDARDIVLAESIPENSRLMGPLVVKLEDEVEGFSSANEEVWHVRIICDDNSLHSTYFINPNSGKLLKPTRQDGKLCNEKSIADQQ